MKKLKLAVILTCMIPMTVCGAQSSNILTVDISNKNIENIEVGNAIEVIYKQSSTTDVKVEAPAETMKYVDVKVSGKCLEARMKSGYSANSRSAKVKVFVSSPTLRSIEASSASSVEIPAGLTTSSAFYVEATSAAKVNISRLSAEKVSLEATSAAHVTVDAVKAEKLSAECTSASSLRLSGIDAYNVSGEATSASTLYMSGKCANVVLEANSAANVDAKDLIAERGNASSDRASTVKCNVKNLNVKNESITNKAKE